MERLAQWVRGPAPAAPPPANHWAEVLDRAAAEVVEAFGDVTVEVLRAEGRGRASVAGACADGGPCPQWLRGELITLHREGVHHRAQRERRMVWIDDLALEDDSTSRLLARLGTRSAVAAPIVVRGRVWGSIGVASGRPGAVRRHAGTDELRRQAGAIGRLLGGAVPERAGQGQPAGSGTQR